MGIRYDEDTGQYIRYSEDEPPEVVYRDSDGENWLTQAQYDQLLAQKSAAASAAAEAEAARMAPFASAFSKPVVSYSGALSTLGQPSGQYEFYMRDSSRDEDGDRTTNFYKDTGSGQIFYYDPEENSFRPHLVGEGNDARYAPGYQDSGTYSYDSALKKYSSGYQPWDWQNIRSGLSDRTPFNLNALWGGTQYAAGRVTDYSHIDPTQYEANLIASNARNELWNVYDQLKSQGNTPAKNPDQVALDFYVQTVGPQGNQYGYGPGANTILVTEAIKNKFLNQPEVVQATGQRYTTPEAQLTAAKEFGAAHEAGVPVWQVFEQQGYSRDLLGSLMPMILGAMIFPGLGTALSGALGGGVAGQIAAASIIGGVNAEIQGGDFLDGAVKAALSAGTGAAIANVGIASEVSSVLKALDFSPEIADLVAKTAEKAVTSAIVAEATGGDAGDAIANVLLSAGISVARSELGDIVNNVTAGETAADIEDAELGAAMTEAAAAPQEALIAAPQQIQPEQIEAETPVETPEVTQEELMAEIQPEIAAPETVVSEVIEAPDVPRETMEELLPEEEPAVELPLEEELPEEQPIPEAMPEVEPEPVLPEEGQVEEMAEEEEAAPEEAMAEEEAPAEEEAAISDEDVLEAMAEEEPGAEEEAMAEEEEAAPAEEAAPEGAEEPVAEEAGGERVAETTGPSDIDRLIAQLLLSDRGGRVSRIGAARETAISPRELSGSVTGIIGKKQPMFGGDEDEQSAEWNRRSLRLRKVLGL